MRCVRLAGIAAAVLAVLGAVTAAPASAGGVTVDQVYSAPVPSLCGYPAGRLVNGSLPGTSPGSVGLAGRDKVDIGVLQAGHAPGAAAVVTCNQGGVAWPDSIVLYTPTLHILGVVRLLTLDRGSESPWVNKMWIDAHRNVHARVFGIAENGDCSACAAATQLLVFHYSPAKHKVVFTTKHTFTEKPAARGFISAFNHRDKKAALRYATRSVVASWFPGPTGMRFSFAGCYGVLSPNFPTYLDPPGDVARACLVDVSSADGTALFMKRTTWKTWKVSAVAIP